MLLLLIPVCPTPNPSPISSNVSPKLSREDLWDLQKGTEDRLSWSPGANMIQQTMVVSSKRMAYINLRIGEDG